jgi:hypothetical protein
MSTDVAAVPAAGRAVLSHRQVNLAFVTITPGMLLSALDQTIISPRRCPPSWST